MKSKVRKMQENNRQDIILTLPSFINQLLLLMNSGAPVQAAFCKIAESYESFDERRHNYFTREICNIYDSSMKNGENVINGFYNFARRSNVRELTRAASILYENQSRGTDLWEKLAEQSELLWEERKRTAMSRIRLAESKMSFPLGILLMALIIITAAPAMLQI